HVHGLYRRDRALAGRSDSLLQRTHVGAERRLVADRARNASQERRHLGARLREAEDVVDEEQHVAAFLVAEILRARQRRETDARARAGRLVHLAVDQRGLLDDTRLLELEPEVVAFARPLAHAGEHRVTGALLRDVANQLLHEHGLADARAAEQTDLPAERERAQEIDDLESGLELLDRSRLLD